MCNLPNSAIDRSLQAFYRASAVPFSRTDGAKLGRRSIGQHRFQAPNVIDRFAIDDGAGAGRIVADHTSQVRSVGGRDVRAELQTVTGDRII